MVKLKIIAFFLSLLMTLQALPLTQIGKMLSTNQWVEEMPHNPSDCGGKIDAGFTPNFLPPVNDFYIAAIAENKITAYLHCSDQVPSNHSTDIVTPPPDVLA